MPRRRSSLAGRGREGLLAAALAAIALSWAGEARAHEEVNEWSEIVAQMEPLSGFFMHSRLAALLNVSIHDALNFIPGSARFEAGL